MADDFELKGGLFTLTALKLPCDDVAALRVWLAKRVAQAPAFFAGAPLVVDCARLAAVGDLAAVCRAVRDVGMHPVAVISERAEVVEQAGRLALSCLKPARKSKLAASRAAAADDHGGAVAPSAEVDSSETASAPAADGYRAPLVVTRPVRSGQQLYARGGDLIVIGSVNRDAEVVADGHIHVYGNLNGKAIAGARGSAQARIFAVSFDAQLVAVAGVYMTLDDAHAALRGQAAQVCLTDGRLLLTPVRA